MTSRGELLQKAERAEAEKRLVDAAVLYERGGDLERAIAAYTRGGGAGRAAQLLEATGRAAQAAALLSSTGRHLEAAAVHERMRDYARAAAALLRGNERERAAAMYERAEAFADAAKLYASMGNRARAAQLYRAAGDEQRAREMEAAPAAAGPAVAGPADEVLELDGSMEVRDEPVVDARRLTASVVALLGAGRVADAARLYASSQEDIGYPVLTAVAGDPARQKAAAQMFAAARDHAKAAECLEGLEEFAGAAALYERADDAYMAAEMYLRAGDQARAATMLERSGNAAKAAELFAATGAPERAAACFEKAGDAFAAGELYARLGKPGKALQLLQRVARGDRAYLRASRIVGEILAAHGQLEIAIRRYQDALQGADVTEDTAPAWAHLARCLEQAGDAPAAVALYERLVAWRLDYEDLALRLKALRGRGGTAPAARRPAPAAAPGPVVSRMDGIEFLQGAELFQDLTLDQLRAIHGVCEVRRLVPGEVLMEQGKAGQGFHVVRKGTAWVSVRTAQGEQPFGAAGPGTPIGVMNLFDDAPSPAQVVAEADLEVLSIAPGRFAALLEADERLSLRIHRHLARTLAVRLRSAGDLVVRMGAGGPDRRA